MNINRNCFGRAVSLFVFLLALTSSVFAQVPSGFSGVDSGSGQGVRSYQNGDDYVTVVYLGSGTVRSVTGAVRGAPNASVSKRYFDSLWNEAKRFNTTNRQAKVMINGGFFENTEKSPSLTTPMTFGLKVDGQIYSYGVKARVDKELNGLRTLAFDSKSASIQPYSRSTFDAKEWPNVIGGYSLGIQDSGGKKVMLGVRDSGRSLLFFTSKNKTIADAKKVMGDFGVAESNILVSDAGWSTGLIVGGRIIINPLAIRTIPHAIAAFSGNDVTGSASVTPGERKDGSLHLPIRNAHDDNGSWAAVGSPRDNGSTPFVHAWGPNENGDIQDFNGGADGHGALTSKRGSNRAYWIHTAIWETWISSNLNGGIGPYGSLGWPTSNEGQAKASPATLRNQATGRTSGRYTRFEGGSVYWSSRYKGHPVCGIVGRYYEARGSTGSEWGFPTSAPRVYNSGAAQFMSQTFEGGELVRRVPPGKSAFDPSSGEGLNPDGTGDPGGGNSGDGSCSGSGSGVGTFVSECDTASRDGAPGFFKRGTLKNWKESSTVGDGKHMLWTYTNGAVTNNSADWRPILPDTRPYEVKVFIPRLNADTKLARYRIFHAEGQAEVTVNQSAYFDAWVSLGTYRFHQGTIGFLRLVDSGGEGYGKKKIAFDSAKWEPREPDVPRGNPLPPDELSPTGYMVSSARAELSWHDAGTSTGRPNAIFDVQIYRDSDGQLLHESGWLRGKTWTSPELPRGYYRWVVFSNNGIDQEYGTSNWAYFTVGPPPPDAPQNLTAVALEPYSVQLSWFPGRPTAYGFEVQRRTSGQNFEVVSNKIAAFGRGIFITSDTRVPEDTSLTYRVRLYNDGGFSEYSSEVSVTSLAVTPRAPSGLTATAANDVATDLPSVTLSWKDNSNNEHEYNVFRRDGSGQYQLLVRLESNSISFSDKGVQPNGVYRYYVSALNLDGRSKPSNEVEVTVPAPKPPSNDNFADAQLLGTAQGSLLSSNKNATFEAGEPKHGNLAGQGSVWYKWVSPISGRMLVATSKDNLNGNNLAVYTGAKVSELTVVAHNGSSDGRSRSMDVYFSAIKGTTYFFALDTHPVFNMDDRRISLTWRAGVRNDNFSDAELITGPSGQVVGTNVGANLESGEPYVDRSVGGKSIWYRWVAPQSGTAIFDTSGSAFDTTLGIYTGQNVGSLNPVVTNDNAGTGLVHSRVSFIASQGTSYYIRLDAFNPPTNRYVDAPEGNTKLNWAQTTSTVKASTSKT